MRIGVLTAGGDCPGLNAVIRSVVHRAVTEYDDEVIGFEDGLHGAARRPLPHPRPRRGQRHPRPRRHHPRLLPAGARPAARGLRERAGHGPRVRHRRTDPDRRRGHADGGPDAVATRACRSSASRRRSTTTSPSTDRTFGFDTAVGVATEAMDRLKTTAESHQRVMVVEVMGRHAGWIALESGMAAGAHGICLPERPFDPDRPGEDGRGALRARQEVRRHLRRRGRAPRRGQHGLRPRARSTSSATSASRASATALAVRAGTPARQGGQAGHPRPRPARRHAHRVRPRPRDPLRLARGGGRAPGDVRPDDGTARDRRW